MMLKAGSLVYAIFVSVITAILCSMMIIMAYMNRSFFIKSDLHEKVYDNAMSGISLGLALPLNGNYEEWRDLYSEGSDSVLLKKRPWGAYFLIASTALKNGLKSQKAVIAGYHSERLMNTALWMADHNKPLHISGDALLKGNCLLPAKGIERAYIEGKHYSRDKMVYGDVSNSKTHIPQLSNNIISYWKDYQRRQFTELDSLYDFEKTAQNISHSFCKKTLVLFSNTAIDIKSRHLKGNIIIQSSSRISVYPSAKMENVMIIAPVIDIEDGFKGSAHFLASDSILIGKEVKLHYPSSAIMTSNNKKKTPYFLLSDNADMRGCVISTSESNTSRNNDLAVEISPRANLSGWLYCQGNLEINGTVKGSVICNKLLLSTTSGIYENHLLDGHIERDLLQSEFSGFALEGLNNTKKPITWVN